MYIESKLDMKLGILILPNKTTPQNWSWHPVSYLEEIRYFPTLQYQNEEILGKGKNCS